ncbi:hypothetical protein [Mesobacillus foraminis]|uniref:hypothetical protein n=1 Tax=Mesobacillus foraminis TaxID=279826 RepID=UPI000EF4F33E|nr:hypothetical protein [Mesobacillus foraminis]
MKQVKALPAVNQSLPIVTGVLFANGRVTGEPALSSLVLQKSSPAGGFAAPIIWTLSAVGNHKIHSLEDSSKAVFLFLFHLYLAEAIN